MSYDVPYVFSSQVEMLMDERIAKNQAYHFNDQHGMNSSKSYCNYYIAEQLHFGPCLILCWPMIYILSSKWPYIF